MNKEAIDKIIKEVYDERIKLDNISQKHPFPNVADLEKSIEKSYLVALKDMEIELEKIDVDDFDVTEYDNEENPYDSFDKYGLIDSIKNKVKELAGGGEK